jgi:hypothetical protein
VPAMLVAGWATGVMVALWLLPCLAFTVGTLVLGGLIGVTRAAGTLIGVWAAVIMTPAIMLGNIPLALRPGSLPVWGALLALGIVVVAVRRSAYTVLGASR